MKSKNKFKVGELVICIKNDTFTELLLTINNEYKVLQLSNCNSSNMYMICNNNYNFFVPESYFISKQKLRKMKINEIKQQI